MSKVTTSGWEAWVNAMPIQPTPGGTLHVIGKVDTHSTDFAHLEETVPQGVNPAILLLTLKVQGGIVPATNPQDVHFTKGLQKSDQYTSIEILHDGKVIKTIKDIKILE